MNDEELHQNHSMLGRLVVLAEVAPSDSVIYLLRHYDADARTKGRYA